MIPGNYPSPSNVKLYIGDVYLDDAFRVDWQAQNPKVPMYSWADVNYRAVAQGREIVSGRLLINYRFPGYLRAAIEGREGGSSIDETTLENVIRENVLEMSSASAHDRIEALMAANAKDDNGYTLSMLESALKSIDSPNIKSSRFSNNSAYRAGATKPFNIKIIYGDSEGFHLSKTLTDCHITGESQTISGAATGGGDMSSSGSPIYEVYSFFCREVEESFSNPNPEA